MGMSKWAKFQPQDGDLILVCGHEDSAHYHWYVLGMDEHGKPRPLPFKRPDGSLGEAKWLCVCVSFQLSVTEWPLCA